MAKAPLLQGGSQTPGSGHNRLPGHNVGGWAPRPCPECMRLFEPKVANQLFCTSQHNSDWNNRATARGRVLTPLSIVARITRNGTQGTPENREIGRQASNSHNALIKRFRDEDIEAGRMPWAEFMIRRVKLGFNLP